MKKLALTFCLAIGLALSATAQLLVEPFTYSDGPLVTRPGTQWTTLGGTAGQQTVISGELFLDDANNEDTVAPFSSAFGGGVITATFNYRNGADISSSAAGDYIACFNTPGASPLNLGRFFTSSSPGGATDDFRLGIATSTGTPVFFVATFTAGVNYTVSISYDFTTNLASLTVDGFGTVTATDAVDTATFDRFQFRQGAGSQGDMFIDNLTVIPEPATYMLMGFGVLLAVQQFRRSKKS